MSCNKNKNRNYKSALQFYNSISQEIAATNILTNPLVLDLGLSTTDTGCAFDFNSRNINVNVGGLFRFSSDVSIETTAAGNLTIAMTLDGNVIPETVKTVTVTATTTASVIHLETIKSLKTCCGVENHNIGIVVISDGTVVGNVVDVSGNALKLA